MFTKAKPFRTFGMRSGPDVVDPAYQWPLIEFNNSNKHRIEGKMPPHINYEGWKAHLVVWLIKKLFPVPDIYA